MQHLEGRDVPANNYWLGTGVDPHFYSDVNWSDGVPTADDTIIFDGQFSTEGVEFWSRGSSGVGQTQRVPPLGGGLPQDITSYAGLKLINGYIGMVTFPKNVTFGEYIQNSGATAQAADTTLSVTSVFVWTGGAVNATANAATYSIVGMASGQIGTDDTSLTSGSKFSLGSGTTLNQSGTLTLNNNGSNVEILSGAQFWQQRINFQNPAAPAPALQGYETTDTGGVHVWGSYYAIGSKTKYVRIEAGGDMDVERKEGFGGIEVTGTPLIGTWSVKSKGLIFIRNGETLKATNGVHITDDGKLYTRTAENGTPQIATIDGRLRFEGSLINLGISNWDLEGRKQINAFSTLIVTGKTELWSGTFEPKFDDTNNQNRDAIDTRDQLSISSFTITPAGAAPVQATAVLVSKNGFVDNVDPINGTPADFVMSRSGDGKKFEVKKK